MVLKTSAALAALFMSATVASLRPIRRLSATEPANKKDRLLWEKELLGVYVSGHPLDDFREELEKRPKIAALKKETRNGIPVVTAGMIETVRELLTKKGDRMAFVSLGDGVETIELVTFPEIFRSNNELLTPGTCVAIKGKISIRNDESTVIVDRIKVLEKKPTKEEVVEEAD